MKRDFILIGVTGQFMSSASASQGRRTHDPGSRYMKWFYLASSPTILIPVHDGIDGLLDVRIIMPQ